LLTEVIVKASLYDENNKIVAALQKTVKVKAEKQFVEFDQTIASPRLWSVEKPSLYKLRVSVISRGKEIDAVTQSVGIRSIKFDKDKGFFLNGKSTKLKGVCIHDDAGALGVAVPPEVWVRG
jgi:beta-galactosidase